MTETKPQALNKQREEGLLGDKTSMGESIRDGKQNTRLLAYFYIN